MNPKKKTSNPVFSLDPPVFLLKDLTVRVVQSDEYERAGELLDQEHYLGDLRTGRALLQAIEYQGHWVALLDWGSGALKLADREQWIGWTSQQRAERLKLVAMNRRFLVLGETRMPNLASRSLALALRALPGQWKEKYGYSPVVAETFSDIEQFEGTCYKAAGWQPRPARILAGLSGRTLRGSPQEQPELSGLHPAGHHSDGAVRRTRQPCGDPALRAVPDSKPARVAVLAEEERRERTQGSQLHRIAQSTHSGRSAGLRELPQRVAASQPGNPSPGAGHRREVDS